VGGPLLLAAPLAVLVLLCVAVPARAYVYWANAGSDSIGRANLDGSGADQSFITGATGNPVGVAVGGGHIYWTGNDTIGRANLDGSGVKNDFITVGGEPWGIAVDGAHIYWANKGNGTIGRANLDGTGVNPSFITGASSPFGVAVDAAHVYWTNEGSGTIGRANLDGSGVDQSFITGADYPWQVAVNGAHIYWTNSGNDTIGRANLDGTEANQSLIPAARNSSLTGVQLTGVTVDGAHIYWSNFLPGTIGRANLDGAAVDQSFINTGPSGIRFLAVDSLGPAAGQQTAGLNGPIYLSVAGRRVHGYTTSLAGTLGSGTDFDNLSFALFKSTGRVTHTVVSQLDDWGVRLTPGEFTINRSRASIDVKVPLGAYGKFDFTFKGRPHRKNLGCGSTYNLIRGTLKGTLRIDTGDNFFKTVTVTRMTGTAQDTATPPTTGCRPPPPCLSPRYTLDRFGPRNTTKRSILLTARTPAVGSHQLSTEEVSVNDSTLGTPFLDVNHSITAERKKPFFSPNPTLSSAIVTTPGGVLTGSLRFKSSARLINSGVSVCKGVRYQETNRSAKVTNGRITARFDSIGTIHFDAGSPFAGMTALRRLP
jgi:virginiamycin B lyase